MRSVKHFQVTCVIHTAVNAGRPASVVSRVLLGHRAHQQLARVAIYQDSRAIGQRTSGVVLQFMLCYNASQNGSKI